MKIVFNLYIAGWIIGIILFLISITIIGIKRFRIRKLYQYDRHIDTGRVEISVKSSCRIDVDKEEKTLTVYENTYGGKEIKLRCIPYIGNFVMDLSHEIKEDQFSSKEDYWSFIAGSGGAGGQSTYSNNGIYIAQQDAFLRLQNAVINEICKQNLNSKKKYKDKDKDNDITHMLYHYIVDIGVAVVSERWWDLNKLFVLTSCEYNNYYFYIVNGTSSYYDSARFIHNNEENGVSANWLDVLVRSSAISGANIFKYDFNIIVESKRKKNYRLPGPLNLFIRNEEV